MQHSIYDSMCFEDLESVKKTHEICYLWVCVTHECCVSKTHDIQM
jgi:hypothetical protein